MRNVRWTLLFCGINTLLLLRASAATGSPVVLQRADGCVVMDVGNAQIKGNHSTFGFEITCLKTMSQQRPPLQIKI